MRENDSAPARTGILIVDDDPAVRRFLSAAFVRAGWTAWQTGDGLEALSLFERHRQDVSMVLIDVSLPGLDGVEVLWLLRQLDADVPCAFMTGCSGHYAVEQLEELSGRPVSMKPFRPEVVVAELSATALPTDH